MLSSLQQKNLGITGPWIAVGLALVMMVTRVGHFGEAGGPPDASWAVFMLAGLWLQDWRAFPAFFALAWFADLVAFSLGTPTDCYSLAYLFLLPAYGSLWAAGHVLGRRTADGALRYRLAGFSGLMGFAGIVLMSGVVCFLWANLGMWWFATTAANYSLTGYLGAVVQYLPGYLLTQALYVAAAAALVAGWSMHRQGVVARG